MAILSDAAMRDRLHQKDNLQIVPLVSGNIKASSVDLRLGAVLRIPRPGLTIHYPYTETAEETLYESLTLGEAAPYSLQPGAFVLAQTLEYLTLPRDLSGLIAARSSLVRMGLDTGISAYINPGYAGHLPVAIKNNSPFTVELVLGMAFCQLILHEAPNVGTAYNEDTTAKYHQESTAIAPKLWQDFLPGRRLEALLGTKPGFTLDELTPEQRQHLGLQ